ARDRAARAKAEARAEGAFGVDLAWYAHLEAQVGFDRGDYEAAAAAEREALAIAPGYHVAEAGLARAMAALGQTAEAIAWYGRAIDAVPQPDYLASLGDLYAISGDPGRATNAYDTVEAGAALSPSNARLYDRQLASFYLDHDRQLDRALAIAEVALGQRPDSYGYDIYGWALYKAGRYDEAAVASDRALATGTPDARFHYHAGYIALARGDAPRAKAELGRALAIGPAFDPLLAGRARPADRRPGHDVGGGSRVRDAARRPGRARDPACRMRIPGCPGRSHGRRLPPARDRRHELRGTHRLA